MSWIDYTIFVFMLFGAISGVLSGPAFQLVRIFCILIPFFAAVFFRPILSDILGGFFNSNVTNVLCYFVIFGVTYIGMHLVSGFVRIFTSKMELRLGNRGIGGLVGIVKGATFCGAIIFGVLTFSGETTIEKINASKVGSPIGKGMQSIVKFIPDSVTTKIDNYAKDVSNSAISKQFGEKEKKEETHNLRSEASEVTEEERSEEKDK